MFIIDIACEIIEAYTLRLIGKRDKALANKDYDKVWKLNMTIDKNINRVSSFSCCRI